MIYRLALGPPNQEDFIEILARGGEATRVLLSPLVLDLSARGRQAPEPAAPDFRGASRFPFLWNKWSDTNPRIIDATLRAYVSCPKPRPSATLLTPC